MTILVYECPCVLRPQRATVPDRTRPALSLLLWPGERGHGQVRVHGARQSWTDLHVRADRVGQDLDTAAAHRAPERGQAVHRRLCHLPERQTREHVLEDRDGSL